MSETSDIIADAAANFLSENKIDTPEKLQQALNSPIGTELKNSLLNNVILSILTEEKLEQSIRMFFEQAQLKELRAKGLEEKIDDSAITQAIEQNLEAEPQSASSDAEKNISQEIQQSEDFAKLVNIVNQYRDEFTQFEAASRESLYNSVDDILGKDGLNIDMSALSADDKNELEEAKQRILDAPSAPDVMKVLADNNVQPPPEEFLPKRGLLDEIRLFGAVKLAADKSNSGKSIKEVAKQVESNSAVKEIGQRYEEVAQAAKNGLSEDIGTILNNGTRALSQDTAEQHASNRSYLDAIVNFKSSDELRNLADLIPSPPPPPPVGPSYMQYHNQANATPNAPDFKGVKEAASALKSKPVEAKPQAPEPEPESDFKLRGP